MISWLGVASIKEVGSGEAGGWAGTVDPVELRGRRGWI
jgi:hypothetical protein